VRLIGAAACSSGTAGLLELIHGVWYTNAGAVAAVPTSSALRRTAALASPLCHATASRPRSSTWEYVGTAVPGST
jgi:hypothetical protein